MSQLSYRENTILKVNSTDSTRPDFADSYDVTAYPVGAIVSSAATSTTITVDAGHSFRVGDKFLLGPGGANTFSGTDTVQSVTATTIVMTNAVTVVVGDALVNLGADSGTSSPNYDASPLPIYSDADGTSAISNSRVTASASGEYSYYHKGDGRFWELIRDGDGAVVDVVKGFGAVIGRFSVIDYGAAMDSTGATGNGADDHAAMLAAVTAANVTGTVYFPEGTSRTSATLQIPCNVDAHPQAKIYADFDSDECIELWDGSTGALLQRRAVLPNVYKSTQSWTTAPSISTDVGVRIVHYNTCNVWFNEVGTTGNGFSVGIRIDAEDTGTVHNSFYLGHLAHNAIQVEIQHRNTGGWCNDNSFYGGRCLNAASPVGVVGAKGIHISDQTANRINGNKFYGLSVENDLPEYALDCYGSDNYFFGLRWEVTGGAPVRWGGTDTGTQAAVNNQIYRGVDTEDINVTKGTGSARNVIIGRQIYDFDDAASNDRFAGIGSLVVDNGVVGTGNPPLTLTSGPGGASDTAVVVQAVSALETAGLHVGVQDGSRNSRAKFFMTDAVTGSGAWGLWMGFSSAGSQPFQIGNNATKVFEIERQNAWAQFQCPLRTVVTTLADNATPSVSGGDMFKTGGTTTITDFDTGQVGQVITILCAAGGITITHNASIIVLDGSVDFVMADGDTLTLAMFDDQVWNEIGRVNLDAATP